MIAPTVVSFNGLSPILVQQYERYLPTAFDESMTLLEKMNKVIQHLNIVGELSSDVVKQWNEVMVWLLNGGLELEIIEKLDEWVLDGTLDTIINTNVFGDLDTRITKNTTDILELTENGVGVSSSFININDYPLLENETDDTSRFKRMFADNPLGGYFVLNSETYMIGASDIVLPSNSTLIGRGSSTIVKLISSHGILNGGLFADNKKDIIIKNIHFDGNLVNQTNAKATIRLRECVNVNVLDCTFSKHFGMALVISGCNYSNFDNCIFSEIDGVDGAPGQAIYGQGVKNSSFSNIKGYNIGDHLFYLDSGGVHGHGENCMFVNCLGTNCGSNGLTTGEVFKIASDCRDYSFTNCHAHNSRGGFRFMENGGSGLVPTRYQLTNCSAIDGTYTAGFKFEGIPTARTRIDAKISNCIAHGNTEKVGLGTAVGFRIENLTGITFTDCDAKTNGRYGFFYRYSNDIVHSGGVVSGNGINEISYGIQVGDNCNSVALLNVKSINSGTIRAPVGILAGCTDVQVVGGIFDKAILMQNGTGKYRPNRKAYIRITANTGDGSLLLLDGDDLVQSVASDSYGLRITLKDLPEISIPTVIPVPTGSSGGLETLAGAFPSHYLRSVSSTAIIVGLKTSPTSSHVLLSSCVKGEIGFFIIV